MKRAWFDELLGVLWLTKLLTLTYIQFGVPFMKIGLKTLMEMWIGKQVAYSHLYAVGCSVYVMYNAHERAKLEQKSRKCIFLGYADGVKRHCLRDPIAHKIVISRDVIFIEDQL